ncbi:MAG: porin family protein [Dysgonomonas sp.]
MRIVTIILFFTLCSYASVNAQQFGIKGSVVIDNSKIEFPNVDTETKAGFNGGLVGNFNLPFTSWGVNTGLLYSYRGFSLKNSYGNETGVTYHFKTHGIEVPVNICKEFNAIVLKPFLQAGLYASYTFSGRVNDGEASRSIEFERKADRFDIGANISVGCKLTSKLRFLTSYGFGFAENKYIFSDQPISRKNRNLTFSLEYFL